MTSRRVKHPVGSILDYVKLQERYGDPFLSARLVRHRFDSFKTLYRKDLYAHYGCVNAIEFSADGEWMVSGGDDKRVLLWNVDQTLNNSPRPKAMKGEHNSNIFCLSFDSSHSKLFSAGNDEQVILHDVKTGETSDVFLHDEAVYGLSVDPSNEHTFASACDDGRILLWDTRASTTDAFMVADCNSAFHAVMHNPAVPVVLVTANAKEGVSLWDVRMSRECVIKYGGSLLSQSAMSVRFNDLGTHILALRRRLPPVLYELSSVHPVVEFDHREYYNSCTMKSCCFAGDSDQYVLSGSDDFKLYMWKIPSDISGKKGIWVKDAHLVLRGHRSIVNQVRCNKSYGVLASSGVEKIIKLWSTFPVISQKESDLSEDKEGLRKVYTHEEYINLVLESGQFMTHDYSHHSVQEDPRMMAFFDSLVQRDIEGWTSDSSETSATNAGTCFEVQSSSSSSSLSSMSSDSSDDDTKKKLESNLKRSTPPYRRLKLLDSSMPLQSPECVCPPEDMTSERISKLIARKRWDLMCRSARLKARVRGNKLKSRLENIKKNVKKKINGGGGGSASSAAANIGKREEILSNARKVLNSAVQNRIDRRKMLMKKRAKLLRTMTISDGSSDSDFSNDELPLMHANGISMDLSVSDVPVQETAVADDKPNSVNGHTSRRSNGAVENMSCNSSDLPSGMEASGSGVDLSELGPSSPPPLPPPLPLPPPPPPSTTPPLSIESNPSVVFHSKSNRRHSRNYRKRNADNTQDD